MVGHGGSSAGSYLADPTSPIPSHCASIVATSTLRVNTVDVSEKICSYQHKGHTVKLKVKAKIDEANRVHVKSLNWLLSVFYDKLEALGERRTPWPRQIITPILPNVKMLSLGGKRLPPKVLDHYLYHNLVMLPL